MGLDVYTSSGARLTSPQLPTYVTSLPSGPIDGQEVYYAADATNGVIWHLRYRSGSSSSYKWEFVGGPALSSTVATRETTTSNSYVALTTAGPSVALPLAGDYDVQIQATIENPRTSAFVPTTSRMSYDIGATGAVDADSIQVNGDVNDNAPIMAKISAAGTRRKTGLSAVTLTAKYKNDTTGAGGAAFANRVMIVTPVRVG